MNWVCLYLWNNILIIVNQHLTLTYVFKEKIDVYGLCYLEVSTFDKSDSINEEGIQA